MKRKSPRSLRFPALLLAFALLSGCLSLPAFALDLPSGWWPLWSAYDEAVNAGDEDAILARGQSVLDFYASHPLNTDIGQQIYMVYYTRMTERLYEKRGDYDAAVDTARKLLEISRYMTDNGVDRLDMILACEAHLRAIEPKAGVYALSRTQKNRYGSSAAAESGTYYGAVGGTEFSDRGIASFYVEMEKETAADFSNEIEKYADGSRLILLNLNFLGEGDCARSVPKETWDAGLEKTFRYLSSLSAPVLVRIGAEMNVWTAKTTPAEYTAAYNHIAAIARRLAPKAELVWAPNYASAWNVDMADFYPKDEYVDWVGVSLYYNYASSDNSELWLEYAHAGRFADPIACAAEAAAVADAHGKPLIVTEGGTTRSTDNGGGGETWAAGMVAREYAALNMVYPQVKAIVHYNRVHNGNDYTLTGKVRTGYTAAVDANPALLSKTGGTAGTWIPLESYAETPSGSLLLGAVGSTYAATDMKAVYVLDGREIASGGGMPNHCTLPALSAGTHSLTVTLSDGTGYKMNLEYTLNADSSGKITVSEGKAPEWKNPFHDVAKDAAYYDAVRFVNEAGLFLGTSDTTFSPDVPMNRAMFVTVLGRLAKADTAAFASVSYTDVESGSWYAPYVEWAAASGLVLGYGDGTFGPMNEITREQAALILARYAASAGVSAAPAGSLSSYPDGASVSSWAKDAVTWTADAGIYVTENGSLLPQALATRAVVAQMLFRFAGR